MRKRPTRGKSQPESQGADLRRLLLRLEQGACLGRAPGGGFQLLEEGTSQRVPIARRFVEACLAADWLERQGSVLVLSEAGRSRLRRHGLETDAFLHQHQRRSMVEREINGRRQPVMVNEGESPLGWLKSRKDRNGRPLITDAQFEAGERLRADYWFAHFSPRVTSNWSTPASAERSRRGAPSNPAALRDEVLAAKERVTRALMAVGPEISGVLVDICCELKGLEDAEKANGWPQRAGKVVLQIALTRLAKHYGLIKEETAGSRRRPVRHWGDADYRPRLDGWQQDAGGCGEKSDDGG